MVLGKFGGAVATLIVLSAPAHALGLTEDFSSGLNGWSAVNAASNGIGGGAGGATLTVPTDGGPAGAGDAYLRTEDSAGGYSQLLFGNGFTGDLSATNGGTLSMDYIRFNGNGAEILDFGRLRVSNSAANLSAAVDIVPLAPTAAWQTASVDFTASAFGVTNEDWATILGNVTEIRFQNESINGVNEIQGFDNVTLAPVPLPAGGALLLAALGFMGFRRARLG